MRKKLFAIVMSMTMVASFMPSLAFAKTTDTDEHTWLVLGTDFDINSDGKAVTKTDKADKDYAANQKEVDKCVINYVAPTHDAKGSYEVKCTDPRCDETKVTPIDALGCTTVSVRMSVSDYAAAALAHKHFENKAAADTWVDDNKDVCYVNVKRCNVCGDVVAPDAKTGIDLVEHAEPTTKNPACAEKVTCANPGCNAVIDVAKPADHSYSVVGTTTAACGNTVTVTESVCDTCKTTVFERSGKPTQCVLKEIAVTSRTLTTKVVEYLYDGKVIAKYDPKAKKDKWTVEPGFHRDATYSTPVFYKADTTVKLLVDNGGGKKVVKTYEGYTCTKCGFVLTGREVPTTATPTHTHTWNKVTKAATCTSPELYAYECATCGKYKKPSDSSVENTFAKAAEAVATSSKLGHKITLTKVAGDCTNVAHYVVGCSACDAFKAGNKTVDFVGIKEGTSQYVDPETGDVRKSTDPVLRGDVEVPYLAPENKGHVFTKKVTLREASCNQDALEGYACDVCGKFNIHKTSPVLGTALKHNYVETKTPATCGSYGKITKVCSLCDDEIVVAKDEAAKPLVKEGADCTYTKWVVTKDATIFEEGVKSLTCSVCGDEHPITKTAIAKAKYAAPAVKAGKKSATVTVKATADAAKYQISYKKAGGSYKTISAKVGKKTIKKLAKGKKYTFKVIAINAEGVKVASATKTIKVK